MTLLDLSVGKVALVDFVKSASLSKGLITRLEAMGIIPIDILTDLKER